MKPRHPYYVLAVLLLVFVLHHVDRNILLVLLEPIRREFGLSDTQLGALSGIAYALPFALAGIPLGALAVSVPMGVMGATSASIPWSLAWLALWSFAGTMFIGPGHSLYLGWAPPQMRATLAAIVIVTSNLVGAGVGSATRRSRQRPVTPLG